MLPIEENEPLKWWRDNEKKFPILTILAKKYLAIPSSSVPSERLFSDAGQQITLLRNRLSSQSVDHVLFLKQNKKFVNNFLPIKE